ncbi:glycosyltransferase family 10 domain-containing protein [Szabonella alba]|uniref:Fucosyltransferase C-terminal domain-containing protein n=1 Tax=Szabonella alba TaxID=2804194 RepID=A0A8K0VGF0_9RHOB|nr:glycosyltransferase family 10 [Szabonella alba]MBL4919325.1 hypothetical protein [Szabonella alba]
MLHDQPDRHPEACKTGSGRHGGILVTRRGWRPQDATERGALDLLLDCGPLTDPETPGLPAYLGFPWSAYFDSLGAPQSLEAPYLRSAYRTLCAAVPQGVGVVTLCTHPGLPDHLDALVSAGVSDVFWPGTMPGQSSLPQAPGLRLHPFPALPGPAISGPGMPPVAGEGPAGAFAVCTDGGNHPRLWAALAAGLIPVLSTAGPLLPGDGALWQAAAVLHDGSGAARSDLPARLADIAADPERLAAMRQAGAGLGLLYGPGRMVHDVLSCLTERADPAVGSRILAAAAPMTAPGAGNGTVTGAGQGLLGPLLQRLSGRGTLLAAEAERVLQQAAGDLLSGHGADLALAPGPQSAAAWRLIGLARRTLGEDSPACARFDGIVTLLRGRGLLPTRRPVRDRATILTGGQIGSGTENRTGLGARPLRVFLLGPRGQRTPLAYAPLRCHLAGRMTFVGRAEEADLVVTGWNRDLEDNRDLLAALWRDGVRPRLVVLSEEPLWDSLWSGGLAPRDRLLDCGDGVQLPYRHLNHANSGIFRFHSLPWFILSDDRFAARYALLTAAFAALSPGALLRHWQTVPWQAAFVAERRVTPDYAAAFPAEGVMGLSLYRSRVADLVPGERVLRLGQGWPGTMTRRQDLPDWHLDKLARLHGQVRLCGAYENTLQADYITEKPFDAFAVGAIPVVFADAGHRLPDLIPPEAMLNTRFCAPDMAAARIAAFVPDLVLAEAWREAAQDLLARLRDPALILAERQRLADACLEEFNLFIDAADSATVV